MEAALNELPLALFTTLAPMGAGAFVALACALFTTTFSDEQLRKIDRFMAIPLIVVLCWGLVPWVMMGAGRFSNDPVRLTRLPGTEFVCGVLAALAALGLCGWTCLRQRRQTC